LLIAALLLAPGCLGAHKNTLTQVGTIDALLAGAYTGRLTCEKLLEYGGTGLGTFDRLDGEMIVLEGRVYRVKASGKVELVAGSETTPFAVIAAFDSDQSLVVDSSVDYPGFKKMLDNALKNPNLFYALKAKGLFRKIHVRSVPAQKKPYPPLVEVVKHQSEFFFEDKSGTLVGFRCPALAKGVNAVGWHLHFISDDKKSGGHVLSFEMEKGEARLDALNQFFMILPKDGDFGRLDLDKDRTGELNEAENEK